MKEASEDRNAGSLIERASSPFKVGLGSIREENWLETGEQRNSMLAKKKTLVRERLGDVFVAEENTGTTQQEVLELVKSYFAGFNNFPDKEPDTDLPPLLQASLLACEDLVVMRRNDEGWRLVAASVCFPSNWWLKEKFGKTISMIHGGVPGFQPDTRNDVMINRIFDHMEAGSIVERFNWTLVEHDELSYWPKRPVGEKAGDAAAANGSNNSGADKRSKVLSLPDRAFFRAERQTLRKMAKSGDILFTIQISIDALAGLYNHPCGGKIAENLANVISGMSEDQLRYKGMLDNRDELLVQLVQIGNRDASSGFANGKQALT